MACWRLPRRRRFPPHPLERGRDRHAAVQRTACPARQAQEGRREWQPRLREMGAPRGRGGVPPLVNVGAEEWVPGAGEGGCPAYSEAVHTSAVAAAVTRLYTMATTHTHTEATARAPCLTAMGLKHGQNMSAREWDDLHVLLLRDDTAVPDRWKRTLLTGICKIRKIPDTVSSRYS